MADPKTYTQEELDTAIAERLAAEVAAIKKNRDEAFDELKAIRRKFDGLDPDEARTAKQRLAELEQQLKADKAGITSEALRKMRDEVRAELEKDFAPKLTELETLRGENRSLKLDTVVKAAMAKVGARAERIDPLFRLSADRFDLTEDGKPMVKGSSKDVEKFIGEDLLKDYPEFFQGTGSSGGGASKSSGGAGGGYVKTIPNDPIVIGRHIDQIAKGEVVVAGD